MNKLSFSANKKVLILIILITCLGGFLRFYKNTINPPSLNIDEVAYGYNAYSILKTGRDEYGVFMPLVFKSTGDYKNPLPVYLMVPSIALFGLNEFGVRFPNALIGILTIPMFFLFLRYLFKKNNIAIIGVILLSISPWHIYYSRYAYEPLLATFLILLGTYFLLRMLKGEKVGAILAAIPFVLAMYTAFAARLFLPLFIIFSAVFSKSNSRKLILLFILFCLLLVLPLLFVSFFGGASTRLGMVFLNNDIDYSRYVVLDHMHKSGENFLLFFFWIKRYLNYFQPDYLFFTGLNMTLPGTLGLGILYLFELPWLVIGLVEIFRKKIENKGIIISWILIGLIPASIANNEQSAGRSLLIVPALLVVVAIGADFFINLVRSIKNLYLKIGITLGYSFFIAIFLTNAFLVFTVHFPKQKGEAFMEGTKEAVEYALLHKNQYKEIVFDPYRGIEAPYIVGLPYMYLLFYSQYDPALYQKDIKRYGKELFGWDKFTIRKIYWPEDRLAKGTLFIGSPWSLPEQDLKSADIFKRVYLSTGDLVFLVVSPKSL